MVNFYCAMAYPGSHYIMIQRKMESLYQKAYSEFSQHSYDTLNLSNDHLTSSQILSFRDEAWTRYHNNEKYLNLLKNKFGENCITDLEQTKSIKLKRKLLGD